MADLLVVQIAAGQAKNFSYLVFCPQARKGIAVDPSYAPELLLAAARERQVQIDVLVNTHGHGDHVAGNPVIIQETGARLAAHPADLPGADIPLGEGDALSVGLGRIEVLHTPGHTPGSITLHPPGALLTGDTLFVTRCGRADLAGSDPAALYHSLRRLAAFPLETRVFPGHDYGPQPVSTIGFELQNNPYLRCADLAEFIRLRMG
ncbi:MBL fold metallo-hydrolase [Desulfuromonas versatilis]|uniref:MBL fold metallo-hydrolase n=1 Tax=Desulfuromonas versatilis TaxID=2802975 RepID=A0ABM8HMI1_9BACT|nr:hydroxyacylglutathione hydrolase family protein [Desulfuromonas versatilis]BCR03510.1 MBL fold metallo-hydrolase [Desulfuromonas versatilis]